MMIVISAVAIMLGVGVAAARLKARSSAYKAMAAEYAFKEELFAKHIKQVIRMADETEEACRESTEESKNHSGFNRLQVMASSACLSRRPPNTRTTSPDSRPRPIGTR